MQIYRSSPPQDIVPCIAGVVLGIIGVAYLATPGPYKPLDVTVGVLFAAAGVAIFLNQVKSRLVVGDEGLTYGNLFRTRRIGWADVHGVEVCSGNSLGPWYSARVDTGMGRVRINSVLGTRSHLELVAAAIRSAQPALEGSSTKRA
ncbi:MAG TPA: PH domain-containing protein [Streptosporangiaceae bacterium]|jgi:hypothetical protein